MNYYERHIGDYLKDTAHLSLLEHGVYGRMLDVYYTREAPLPVAQVERLIGVRTKEEREAQRNVVAEFFVVDGDMLRHSRCDREIARYQEKQRKASASANARWKKGSDTDGRSSNAMRTHMRTHSEGNAPSNQTPDTSNQNQGADVEHQQVGPVGPARAGFEEIAGVGDARSPASVALAEQAAGAMQAAGLADVSASHPKLRALVSAGMTVAELAEAARVAAAGGKGFPWALARAEGQRRDAAQVGALPDAAPAVDPDSRVAIEADGERFGIGRWEQLDAAGNTVPWSVYSARVRAARSAGHEHGVTA